MLSNFKFKDKKWLKKIKILSVISVIYIIWITSPLHGYVMESSGYRIQSDSVNVGGLRSESASYIQESTVGEIATGLLNSASYSLKAGYQQMQQDTTISISAIPDITMSPNLGGISGGTSNGSAQFTVTTNNSAGFSLTIKTDSNNGMEDETSTGFIPHLTESTPYTPDFTFTAAPANSAAFAYTINSSTTGEIIQAFRNNGLSCNDGASETDDNCWIAATTTARTIVNTSSPTPSSGATSTIRYRVVISSDPNPVLTEDIYTATTTLTAVTL